MEAINKDNFGGKREVTCYSCHHGTSDPAAIPVILAEDQLEKEPEHAEAAALPSADQILAKYTAAVGGADALEKVSSRVEKGTISVSGSPMSIEIFAKAPDKRISIVHTPNGESATAFDGHAGWLGNTGRPPRPMSAQESSAARLDASFRLATQLKQMFTGFRVRGSEKVDDHETWIVTGTRAGSPPVNFYFDQQSGLLVRQVRYTETALGRLPTQIDYADYREADGVKLPFRWTLERTNGRFTIQVQQVEQNVAIDDAKFAMPAAPAASKDK
jgi:outer membrane lipoprotein-sorting protein